MNNFFIKFLTDEDDIVFDPFAGSNTTGAVAELLGRNWFSIEPEVNYASGSIGWFSLDNVVEFPQTINIKPSSSKIQSPIRSLYSIT